MIAVLMLTVSTLWDLLIVNVYHYFKVMVECVQKLSRNLIWSMNVLHKTLTVVL